MDEAGERDSVLRQGHDWKHSECKEGSGFPGCIGGLNRNIMHHISN